MEPSGSPPVLSYVLLIVATLVLVAMIVAAWRLRNRVEVLGEFFEFLRERKLWWLTPMILVFVMAGLLIAIAAKSGVAAFIYTLF